MSYTQIKYESNYCSILKQNDKMDKAKAKIKFIGQTI